MIGEALVNKKAASRLLCASPTPMIPAFLFLDVIFWVQYRHSFLVLFYLNKESLADGLDLSHVARWLFLQDVDWEFEFAHFRGWEILG